jgi:hypothetical protein
MRILIISSAVLSTVACGRAGTRADTASSREPTIVSGPPAVPATLPPAETAKTSSPRSPGAEPTITPPKVTTAVASTDSVRGTVSVVGTSFDKRVMIEDAATRRRVEVTGSLSRLIGHVAGAEVSAVGALSGSQLEASRFLVRAVDGQPAIDGTLKTEGGAMYIVTTSGVRTRLAAPPPSFAGQDGARVWITGDPAKGIASFGFIDPPR